MKLMTRFIWPAAAVSWLLFVAGLSVSKSLGQGLQFSRVMEQAAGGDTHLHALLAAVMAFLVLMAAPTGLLRGYFLRLVNPVFLLLVLLCLFDELLQLYIPARQFSWMDFLASFFGLVFGSLPALLLRSGKQAGC